jgi:hypothetical protein
MTDKIQKMKSILKTNNQQNNSQQSNKVKKDKIKVKQDSSDISSYDSEDDNMTNADIQQKAKETYMQTELFERITKYIKIDNNIREKQKELREFTQALKKQKQEMEKYILSYLTEVNQEYVKIDGDGKLTKSVSIRKGAIKPETIKKSVLTGLKKENINLDDNRINDIIESILTIVDDNRPKTTKTYIKRTYERKKKDDKQQSKKDIDKKNKDNDSDEELPKYKSK